MGIDYNTCCVCEKVRLNDYTFSFDESIKVVNDMLKNKEIRTYLFEEEILNEKGICEIVKHFLNCKHSICDSCIIEITDKSTFSDVLDFPYDKDWENDKLEGNTEKNACFFYISALKEINCLKCKNRTELIESKEELSCVKNRLMDLCQRKSITKKELINIIKNIANEL